MESKDLRIGNLVKFGDAICKVIEITTIAFYVLDLKTGETYKNTWADLQPISLSEDILLKCGAKYDCYNRPYIERGAYQITFCEQANGVFHARIHREDMELKEGLAVGVLTYYQHQLQNLYFALTNTELEINLNN